jgi:hypothetical protein
MLSLIAVTLLSAAPKVASPVQPTQFGPELNAWDEFRSLAWADDAGFVVARASSSGRMQPLSP